MPRLLWLAGVAIVAATTVSLAKATSCDDCLRARYWTIAPNDFEQKDDASFPETEFVGSYGDDFGVAFSGGGTRSASATVGELRGLMKNGWLARVRYVGAVSGGSWTAIPFAYWRDAPGDLLGTPLAQGQTLNYRSVIDVPNGTEARYIAESQIVAPSFREVFGYYRAAEFDRRYDAGIESALGLFGKARREGLRENKTYTRILEDRFITKLLGSDGTLRFTWNDTTADAIARQTGNRLASTDFIKAGPRRPFLIVGGTMVWQRPAFEYPRLIPVEYTPIYSGIRQQFGDSVGGTYVDSWAYDSIAAEVDPTAPPQRDGGYIRVKPAADNRRFTLSEVAASSGAAPQLQLLVGGNGSSVLKAGFTRAAGYFPSYAPISVRDGKPTVLKEAPHGDGGFSDFFGLMPLLARHVHNILMFVNSNDEFDGNRAFESLFRLVDQRDAGGDPAMNVVFPDPKDERFERVSQKFRDQREAGLPLVFCEADWTVARNELYNIRGYEHLNICFFYNHKARGWSTTLDEDLQKLLAGQAPDADKKKAKTFDNFPLYRTFEQNPPYVIDLSVAQVNLLGALTEWVVTCRENVAEIRKAMPFLPQPGSGPQCADHP